MTKFAVQFLRRIKVEICHVGNCIFVTIVALITFFNVFCVNIHIFTTLLQKECDLP